jgi:gamma-glutamylcyclotransferase (GGCT)/AIG2-like uncharacterized protein YtfP
MLSSADPDSNEMLLFVYGTLRRGASNHHELRDARFAGKARTSADYDLVDLGGYPAVIEGGSTAVLGELYEVDEALLSQLDVFEDVPELYERKRVMIDLATSGLESVRARDVEAYVMPRERVRSAPRIVHGDWIACSH